MQIAGDLLDLVGDGAFETVQDLLMVRPNNLVLACGLVIMFFPFSHMSREPSAFERLLPGDPNNMCSKKAASIIGGKTPRLCL